MTEPAYVTVDGREAASVRLLVGYVGPWQAWVHLNDDEPLPVPPERVTIRIGSTSFVGVVAEAADGTQGLQRFARIVGGAGAWGDVVATRSYHNDAGVKARLVVDDLATMLGESVGSFEPASTRIGRDYARQAEPASVALTNAIGPGVAWYVDYAGVTHVGARPTSTPDVNTYQVLEYDPRENTAELSVDDAGSVVIGSTLTNGLDAPATVRELEITADGNSALKVRAWLGGVAQQPGRLAGLITALVRRVVAERLYGIYRYRIVSQLGDGRLDLQSVNPGAGLPDLTYITSWPGVSGVHGDAAPGGEVLVQFVEGNRAQPIVTAFAPYGADGFTPVELVIGGDVGPQAARQNDAVEVLLPPAVFSGTIGGSPASGVITFVTSKAVGVITGGSAKVQIA